MEKFEKTVLTIAIIIFTISFIVTGYLIRKGINDTSYPPTAGSCPDYWKLAQPTPNPISDSWDATATTDQYGASQYTCTMQDALKAGATSPPGYSAANQLSTTCVNTFDLGNIPGGGGVPTSTDFGTKEFMGPTGDCMKYNWAVARNLTWDGITNANPCNLGDDKAAVLI